MDLNRIKGMIQSSSVVKEAMVDACSSDITRAVDLMVAAVKKGGKILWCGNGGSAADAQHMAAELMGGLRDHNRKAIPSVALTTDTSFITAWANDTDYDSIFSRQIEGLGQEGDVLVAISTSGNSTNVLAAIQTAKNNNIHVIILSGGSGGKMKNMGDVEIRIPSEDTQRIQEGHLLAEHILCECVESSVMD